MCGIFGVLEHSDHASDISKDKLRQAAQSLSHRGPDYQGIYSGQGVGFAHARLSLLDLNSRSNQPFWDSGRNHCLIYNGEIYNYIQLRDELVNKGVVFNTTSDTEVLLELIKAVGLDCALDKLEGMYAFALWSPADNKLQLVRDPLGIKPLFIHENTNQFLFSSEIMPFQDWMDFQPDMLSILSYLQGFGGPSKGFTFYKDVKIVAPGTIMEIKKGESSKTRRFYNLARSWEEDQFRQYDSMSTTQLINKLDEMLYNSVNQMLIADVPVGALCSGGLDSSIITAMASKEHKNLAIFHANVTGPESEFDAANRLAKHLNLDMVSVDSTHDNYLLELAKVTYHYGHPIARHPNSVPFYLVAKLINENKIKAVLSGEGADECFMGYGHLSFDLRSYLKQFPKQSIYKFARESIRTLLGKKKNRMDWSFSPIGFDRRYFSRRTDYTNLDFGDLGVNLGNRFEYSIDIEDATNTLLGHKNENITEKDIITFNMLAYHLRTLLHRNDCLGMAASVESRFPFLHSDIINYAIHLPYRHKSKFNLFGGQRQHWFFTDKWILRQVAKRYLPEDLSGRKKIGFPASGIFEKMKITREFYRDSFIKHQFQLSNRELDYLLDRSSPSTKIGRKLLSLEVWAHVCLGISDQSAITQKMQKYITI